MKEVWARDSPSCQHLNKMLLGSAWFFALAQTAEDATLLQKSPASSTLDLDHLGLVDVTPWWDGVEVKVFAQDNDARPVLQHVSGITLHGLNGHGSLISGEWGNRVIGGGSGDCLCDGSEKVEHVL